MKSLVFFFCFALCLQLDAQCDGSRFRTSTFTGVSISENIIYSQVTPAGLRMDVYEPTGDVSSARPLIIMAHGGSFIAGDENSEDIVAICNAFAKRGYVTASIQYRLTDSSNLYDSLYMMKTVINATQDMRAAVRYFRKDAATINSFKIDTSMIFIGGASAGAISALHTGILTEQTELPSYIQNIVNTEGGLEGNSGSPGYSSNVAGIINLCGALNRAEWISSTSVPIVSIHGTQDGTVPFGHGEVLASSVGVFANLITVDGSSPIHNRAQSLNVKNQLWAIEGADHMAHTLPQYQQQAETFVSDFLYTIVCPNSSIDEILDVSSEVNVYPNPTRDILNIDMTKTQFKAGDELYFYDVFGHVALQGRIDSKFVTINTDTANGIYQLVIKGENITAVKNVVVGK